MPMTIVGSFCPKATLRRSRLGPFRARRARMTRDIFETSARRRRPAPPSGRSDRGEEIAKCPGDVVGKLIDEEVPAGLLEAEAKE